MSELLQSEKEKIEQNGVALLTQAETTTILTTAQYSKAVEGIKITGDYKKAVHDAVDPVCDAANKAHKAATALRKSLLEPYEQAEKLFKSKCNAYDLEQERLRQIEENRLRKIREDEERKAREEQDRKLAEAAELANAGNEEAAQELLEDAVDIQDEIDTRPEIVVEKAVPKGGVVFVDNWKAVILDPKAVPRDYCIPDQRSLDAFAKAMKGNGEIPGVRFVNDRIARRG